MSNIYRLKRALCLHQDRRVENFICKAISETFESSLLQALVVLDHVKVLLPVFDGESIPLVVASVFLVLSKKKCHIYGWYYCISKYKGLEI